MRQDNIGSLQPNYTSIREPYVTMPDDLDGNYILFRVDDGQDVAESNESNNIQAVEIQVNSNEGANLVIESPDVNPWNGVEPGMRMYFSGTVHNIGDTGTLMTSRVGFFLSDDNHWDSGDLLLVTGYFGSILPDGTAEVSRDIPLPANQLPGTYYIIFYVDYQERVPESNEDDNIAAMAIEVTYVQEMTIFTPNDQTVWGRDRDHLIEWASNQGGTVRIELFKSLSLNQLIASNAPNNCSFNWHTPGDLRPEDHYRIKITSNHNASASDMSDYFEIVYSDEVTVIAPNGGEELGYNTSRNISWQGTWNGTANIDLYRNGIFYRQIDTNVPTTSVRPGVYSWLIPDDIPVGSNYLAYVYNTSDAATNDISDATFTISETDPNDPPVAVDDGAVTTRDNPVTIMVLDNDNPPPGSSLQIAGVTQGQNGSVAIDPGNTSVTYTPNSGFIGSDSFEYIVDSGERATVFVTVLDAGTDNDLWARQISGPEGANGNKIAVDSAGNIYVIGSFKGSISSGSSRDVTLTSSGNYDAVIAKYNPSGELQWAQKAGGIARDLGNDIAVDDAGNAYIVGTFDESMSFYNGESVVYTHEQIPGSGWEVFVAKYNSQGVFQWADIGTGIFDDAGKSITIDPANGRLYVGGTFSHAITFGSGAYSTTLNSDDTDLFIVQYTLDGNPIQAEQVSGDGPGSIRSMAVDASGNLYVAGYFNGEAIFGGSITLTEPGDFFIAAFNSAGNALWAQKTHSSYSCEGWGIIVSPTGALYTTGSYGQEIDFYYGNTIVESMTGNNYDFFVARYNPDNGHLVWARKAGGLWYDFGFDIAINSADHPVVTGYFSNIAEFDAGSEPPISVTSDRGSSIFIAEYDQNGELVTIQKSGSGGGAMGIAYDQTGNICLTGSSGNYLTFGQGASFVELSGNDNDIGMFVARLSESTGFPNNPPIAEDDESFTEMDIPVTIPVLENDEDFDGDPLLITDVTQPAHGTAIIDVDGLSIVYTPIAGYYGEDNFDYTISDGNGETADAAVDITVILTSIVNGDELKIFSLDPSSGFGSSVSIHGDYAISGGGSAYIFRHTANGWEQEAKVDIEQPFNIFGESVAIADGHAIVGAYGDNEDGSISGAAYIFSWDGTDWILDNEIDADDNESGDQFSRNAVSVSGDYAIVGSVGDDDASSYSGSAYIFRRNGSTWYQQQKLTASDADYYAFFGNSVSISGEYAVVGAPRHQYRGGKEGAAYVFKFNGQGWEQQAKLIANDREINDNFGQSVSIDGNKIAIGSIGDDDNGENAGAIYIFERVGTTWNQIEKLVTSDYEQGQQIGKSVSISGNRVVAGCAFQLGSVYVFKQTENGWVQERKLTASDGEQGDSFAEDVSVSGNYVISGAYGDDDMGENAGAAYIYDLSEVEQTPTISVTPTSIDFAEITTGECSESQSITIANIGNAPLTVSGQTIDDAQFNIDSGGGSFTLQPGDAHTTEILFCPTSGGEQSAILQINSDDLDNPQVQTELSGTGLEAVESHCDYTVTGSPSTLIITGIEIDGEPLEAGDEVCVYDDDLPVGSVEFEGTYNLPLTAWEGVPSQGLPGYTAGNDISIRIWDSSEQSEITACDLNFAMGDGAFGFAPFSVLSISCNNVVEQCVDLTANQYNMISFNIDPGIVPVCDLFHTGLGNALQIVENGLGGSCAPEFGIDTIGDYIPGQAYRIYISGEDTQLCMEGMHIQDPPAVILEPNRWNWVGYTCPTPVPVEHVFSSIDCIDMVRDNNGNAWVPAWNVNSIGDMSLGSGYEVFITCSDPVEFIANCTVGRELASASIIDLPIPNPSSNSGDESSVNPTTYDLSCFTYTQTGLAYTLIFSDITIDGEPIEAGDEIAVFDDDLTVGGGVFDGDFNYAFSVWQADSLFDMPGFQSGNPMSFKIFDQSSNQILDATPAYIVGSGAFGDSIYTVLSLAAFSPTELPACLAYGIHDEGRNDSQFFTIDLNNNNQIDLLGDMHDDYDIEGIEIHPASGVIFATAGSDNEHDLDGFLFTVDAETGELNPIGYTGYSEIVGLSFRPSDNTLWGWSEGYGLIFINIGDGSATLEFESNRNMEGLAWNNEGTTLYASMNRELWTYHPGDDAMIQIDENLPGVTEALEMRRDGYLMGSTDQVDNLTIFAYDVEIMQVVATEEIVTDYNDIESLAWPDWCDWDIRTRCIDIYANRYNYISFGWELTNPAVENVFSQLDSLLVVTSNDGGTYIPGNINTIGDVTPGEVYRLFISGENASLCVNGNSLALPIPPVLQPNQWNWVASTCQDLVLVEDFFSEILDDIVIVTDDNNGLVFIPNLVNTIEYIMPNVGYKVYTTLGGVASFGYDCPGNAAVAGMSELTDAPMSEHFTFTRTGQSYTIVVTEAQLSDHSLEACAEIGVFDRNLCVGSVIVTGENFPLVIPVWQGSTEPDLPGYADSYPISFRVWQDDQITELEAEFEHGDGTFGNDLFTKVSLCGDPFISKEETLLRQNYPNPFNPVTVIRYTLAESGEATLQVYSSAGRLVRTLSSGLQESGEHSATWDGQNDRGQKVATGVYFYRLQAHEGKFDQTRKMILMK
ncbi:MAG: hypothetical protein B6244_08575 [Candidatus Cloacimonetes bacterium 4572_55]|nr:MAG: hypothetical protein B6244_08575 [Candidatus Cloacimonetes bacterium 4572_55]